MLSSHALQYYLFICFAKPVIWMPRKLALFIGACIGQFAWLTGIRRDVILSNLRRVFPQKTEKEIVRLGAKAARNFGRSSTEMIRYNGKDGDRLDELVRLKGNDKIVAALKSGRGCILTTGHFGTWGIYFAALAAEGLPVSLLVGRQRNKRIDAFVHRTSRSRTTLIPKGRSAVKKIITSLDEGRCVIMVADQHAGSGGTLSEFLGKATPMLALPGAFVARNRIPCFNMVGHRGEDGTHLVEIEEIPVDLDADKEIIKQSVTDAYSAALGNAILEGPEHYFWYHRRWRDSDDDLVAESLEAKAAQTVD